MLSKEKILTEYLTINFVVVDYVLLLQLLIVLTAVPARLVAVAKFFVSVLPLFFFVDLLISVSVALLTSFVVAAAVQHSIRVSQVWSL